MSVTKQNFQPLNSATVSKLAPEIAVPAYDRSKLKHGIVHIGVGGFFRAHQAVYLDNLLAMGGSTEWGLCGVGLLIHDRRMFDAMRQQHGLYTVVERSADGDRARIIGSMTDMLFAPDNPEAVLEKMASPDCRIVSMTITEGGYYVNSGTGEFDAAHADIVRDLANPHKPTCVYGLSLIHISQPRSGPGCLGGRKSQLPQRHGRPHHSRHHRRAPGHGPGQVRHRRRLAGGL